MKNLIITDEIWIKLIKHYIGPDIGPIINEHSARLMFRDINSDLNGIVKELSISEQCQTGRRFGVEFNDESKYAEFMLRFG